MKKIITLFKRNYDGDRLVRNEITPGAEWVVAGEGIATQKFDGTCCMIKDGKLFKRYEVKNGKTPPAGFIPSQDFDPETGKWPGWLPVGDGPEDQRHREALGHNAVVGCPGMKDGDGTYELLGPKINGDPERAGTDPKWFGKHMLVPHGFTKWARDSEPPRDYDGLKEWLPMWDIEGIVWHHPDGRMVKIKTKDFGQKRYSNPRYPICK